MASAPIKMDTKSPEEIQHEIERTLRSISRTVGRLESEIYSYSGQIPAKALMGLGRLLRPRRLSQPIRRHPLLSVLAAASVGVLASRVLRNSSARQAAEALSPREAPTRRDALAPLALTVLFELGTAAILRSSRFY